MKRPLALFGGVFLLATIAAICLPQFFVLLVAGLLLAALLVLWVLGRKTPKTYAGMVAVASASAACFSLFIFQARVLAKASLLDGSKGLATALVLDARPGYGSDTQHCVLLVSHLDGVPLSKPVKVQVSGMGKAEIGWEITLELRLGSVPKGKYGWYEFAKGRYLRGTALSPVETARPAHTLASLLRELQYRVGETIYSRLPVRLGSVAAAMAVGDSRFLLAQTKEAYRSAGLSHLLVVSGLHLSLVCSLVYQASVTLLRKRRVAAALSLGVAVLFAVFTGGSPSILRSAVQFGLVSAGLFVQRRADVYTSLGAAALVLVLANPYAAVDIGLLLSFSAVLAMQVAGKMTFSLGLKHLPGKNRLRLAVLKLCHAAKYPLCISLATFPVLALWGMPVSLLSVPAGLLALPFVIPLVLFGFIMGIPAGAVILQPVAKTASLCAGFLLVLLERLTTFCQQSGFGLVLLGSGFVLCVALVVYGLCILSAVKKRRVYAVFAVAVVLPLAMGLQLVLRRGTVLVSVAFGGQTPSVVISSGGKGVVLYHSSKTLPELQTIFKQQNIRECVLLVDLRAQPESRGYQHALNPQQVVVAQWDLVSQQVFYPMEDVTVLVAHQGKGNYACADVGGFWLGVASGQVNVNPYPFVDVLLCGKKEVTGAHGPVLVSETAPKWVAPGSPVLYASEGCSIVIRPGGGVLFREAKDGYWSD